MNRDNMIEVEPLDKIKQEERIRIISDYLVKGKSRKWIIDELSKEWDCSRKTITAIINETIVMLSEESSLKKEDIKVINNARLEEIFSECSTVKQKLATIDLINKTTGVYQTDITISNKDDSFKFDIGVDMNDESNKE